METEVTIYPVSGKSYKLKSATSPEGMKTFVIPRQSEVQGPIAGYRMCNELIPLPGYAVKNDRLVEIGKEALC